MKKKILALSLALALTISAIPVFADAETGDTTPTENPPGVELDKTLTYNETTGEYTITLESFTTGTVTTDSEVVPTDIILVLDQSGSMADDFDGNSVIKQNIDKKQIVRDYTITRQTAMQKAVADFILQVGSKAASDNVDHKIALVTFDGSSEKLSDYSQNYGSKYTWSDNRKFVQEFNNGWKYYVKGSFTDTGTDGSLVDKVLNLSNQPSGSTNSKAGMEKALALLKANVEKIPEGEKRNQVVIMFTDGTPTTHMSFSDTIADGAIKAAYDMQNLEIDGEKVGAQIYTIGIFDDANNANIIGTTSNENKYMHYTSSNYPNAKAMNNTGSRVDGSEFYLTAEDSTGLSGIFDAISSTVTAPTYSLKESSVVLDVVSNYFELPVGFDEGSISAKKVPCSGFDEVTQEYVWDYDNATDASGTDNSNIKVEGRNVSVKGFNYDDNFVSKDPRTVDGKDYYGAKLVISFTVKPIDDFIGGNLVPSNDVESGIYDDEGKPVGKFPQPTENIEIKHAPEVSDQTIYLGNSMNYADLLTINDKLIDGTNNAFVDITYSIYKDENGDGNIDTGSTPLNTVTILAGTPASEIHAPDKQITPEKCTDYILTYTVSPSVQVDGGVESLVGTTPFTIHVLQPYIEVNDLYVNYNTSGINLRTDCAGELTWKQDTEHTGDDGVTVPSTDKPSVVFTFEDQAGTKTEYTAEEFQTISVTEDKTFKITKVTTTSTDGKKIIKTFDVPNDVPEILQKEFSIYINRFDLTISKTLNGDYTDDDVQDLIVNVENNGSTTKVIFTKDELTNSTGTVTKTISGLYSGFETTVEEDANWSWRWTPSYTYNNMDNDGTFTVNTPAKSKTPPTITEAEFVGITNNFTNSNWVSVSEQIKNIFGGNA